MPNVNILENAISVVDHYARKPEQFLNIQDEVALELKDSIKSCYDFIKEQCSIQTNALPELVTEGFDEEQIWQQLELQNEEELEHLVKQVAQVSAASQNLRIPLTLHQEEENPDEVSICSEENTPLEENESTECKIEVQKDSGRREKRKRIIKSSIVDDKFFKLQELDEYLTKQEKKEKQTDIEDRSDEDSVDLFNDISDNEAQEDDHAKFLKYADFFDSPESDGGEAELNRSSMLLDDNSDGDNDFDDNAEDGNEEEDEEHETGRERKKVKFNLTNDSDETDSTENKMNEMKEENSEIKSSFETRQERLQKKIQAMENAALSEKPWQLKGEVGGTNRPQNSLLEEFVEFDITTRPAPVITEQVSLRLEDIIKRRIKDKAWDDVEKKFKPVETPLEYKKKLILNQEKSKESLSQIYENEYLKQKQKILDPDGEHKEAEEEEPKLHIEIREKMQSLFSKLDALSNFHYTPKPAIPEIKIISNIPAINMEEVAPIATADATLLAPEEVKAKPKGDPIGKSERTKTDMKRERRKKKLQQRLKQKAREEKDKSKPEKYNKTKADEIMKKLSKNRNVSRLDESDGKIAKSSTAFFNQLQDQVKSQIKSKTSSLSKKKAKNLTAVKLKL